jgi:hypothetical protein
MGRPPIFGEAMTAAERQRRHREHLKEPSRLFRDTSSVTEQEQIKALTDQINDLRRELVKALQERDQAREKLELAKSTRLHSVGGRTFWLHAIASAIMDGFGLEAKPPSLDWLYAIIPGHVGTSINDGHCTAAIVFGEKKRKDYKAGQRFIVEEMVSLLRAQGFVGGDDQALTWLKPLDGQWTVVIGENVFEYTIYGQRERRLSMESIHEDARQRARRRSSSEPGALLRP